MKRNRSAVSGKFVDKEEARENPDTTVTETVESVSPMADLINHVRQFVEKFDSGIDYRLVFESDLKRLEEEK